MNDWRQSLSADHVEALRPATPKWQPPMLATLATDPPSGRQATEHVYERKLDGYRIIAVCTPHGARLYSRSGHDVTERFPLTSGLPRLSCVLDGEAVAFVDGQESFAAVQRGHASHLVFFDILQFDDVDVRPLPWHQRRPLLDAVPLTERCARLPWTESERPAGPLLERACAAGWEGLIAKRKDAPYVAKRSRAWLKLKCIKGQEFVIGGYTDPAGSRTDLGALLVGYHDGGLRYAGKVGTGFDRQTLRHLRERFADLSRTDPPFVDPPPFDAHWIEPVLVCRVDFTEWTNDGRLRHPRYLGLRDDKRPLEVTREA